MKTPSGSSTFHASIQLIHMLLGPSQFRSRSGSAYELRPREPSLASFWVGKGADVQPDRGDQFVGETLQWPLGLFTLLNIGMPDLKSDCSVCGSCNLFLFGRQRLTCCSLQEATWEATNDYRFRFLQEFPVVSFCFLDLVFLEGALCGSVECGRGWGVRRVWSVGSAEKMLQSR